MRRGRHPYDGRRVREGSTSGLEDENKIMVSSYLSRARLSAVQLAHSLAGIGLDTSAQELEPRTYANIPVGLNFLIASYGYTTGGGATDPTIPLQNASVDAPGIALVLRTAKWCVGWFC
jgi:hypothetical protein